MLKYNKKNRLRCLLFLLVTSLLILISCDILSMPKENKNEDDDDYINLTINNNSIRIINGLSFDWGSQTMINLGKVSVWGITFPYNYSIKYNEKSENLKVYIRGRCPNIDDGDIGKLIVLNTSNGGDKNISITLEDPLHDSWDTENLSSGSNFSNAVSIPEFDKWYTSYIDNWSSVYYKIPVIADETYEISWDENNIGSGDYYNEANIVVYPRKSNQQMYYNAIDKFYGFTVPLEVTAEEDTLWLEVFADGRSGNFAIGIHKK